MLRPLNSVVKLNFCQTKFSQNTTKEKKKESLIVTEKRPNMQKSFIILVNIRWAGIVISANFTVLPKNLIKFIKITQKLRGGYNK